MVAHLKEVPYPSVELPQTVTMVILFDGKCNLCNATVGFLLPRLQQGSSTNIKLASLQGKTAESLFAQKGKLPADSVLVWLRESDQVYSESEAAFLIARYLTFPWPVVGLLLHRILPSSFADICYRVIAENRYAWFGERNTCMLPNESQREYFLP